MQSRRIDKRRQRAKRDIAMLSICAFAFIGGVIVIRGFAARQVNTLEAGVVSGDSIAVSGKYRLEVVAGLRYCFRTNSAQNAPELLVYSNGNKIAQLSVVPDNLQACFGPQNQTSDTIYVVPVLPDITVEEVIIENAVIN